MSDIELRFFGSLLSGDNFNFTAHLSSGITPEYMVEESSKAAIKFIDRYIKQFHRLPSPELVGNNVAMNITYIDPKEYGYWANEIRMRCIHEVFRDGIANTVDLLSNKRTMDAVEFIDSCLKRVYQMTLAKKNILDIEVMNDEIMSYYNRVKNNDFGILSPWPTVNQYTLGWNPGEMVIVTGRLKTGKTFLLLKIAQFAWMQNKKVLFVSAEMSQRSSAMRFCAIQNEIAYHRLRRGELSEAEEKEFLAYIKDFPKREDGKIWIFGDDFKIFLHDIEAAISQHSPDLVIVDGMYLINVAGVLNRFDKAPIISSEIKMMAKRYHIPIIGSTQLSRGAVGKKTKELDASMISLSDAYGWDADCVIAMIRDETMQKNKELMLKTLAIREGNDFTAVLNWDFDRMDFSEKVEATYENFHKRQDRLGKKHYMDDNSFSSEPLPTTENIPF